MGASVTIVKKDGNYEHSIEAVRGVDITLCYQSADIEILRYRYPEGMFFFRPPRQENAIKTYQLLCGNASIVRDQHQLQVGDIVVLRHSDEAVYFYMTEGATFLVNAFNDNPYSVTLGQYESIHNVLQTIQDKDHYTKEHGLRVWNLAQFVAIRMGLSGSRLRNLLNAARFHDVGKVTVPGHILNKPGRLTPEEYDVVKEHVLNSKEIIAAVEDSDKVYGLVEMHHERLDGSGYPHALPGDKLPMEARILGVLDSFDAMTTNRVYKKGMDMQDAIAELYKLSDIKYDRDVVDALVEVLNEVDGLPTYAE